MGRGKDARSPVPVRSWALAPHGFDHRRRSDGGAEAGVRRGPECLQLRRLGATDGTRHVGGIPDRREGSRRQSGPSEAGGRPRGEGEALGGAGGPAETGGTRGG